MAHLPYMIRAIDAVRLKVKLRLRMRLRLGLGLSHGD
jgi:hypothetical protein